MCTATGPTTPADTGQALAMVRAGLGYLADCDAGSLGTAVQAEALIGLERAEAQQTAARAKILSVFTAQHGYEADGQYGPAAWLRALTKVTRRAAGTATGWARRLAAHPVIAAALAAAQVPVSLARLICDWTDQLPDEHRDDADGILLADNPFLTPAQDEQVFETSVRYRTVGDMTCTGAVESTAATISEVITEIAATRITERGQTRADDRASEAAMEDRKREGYF